MTVNPEASIRSGQRSTGEAGFSEDRLTCDE